MLGKVKPADVIILDNGFSNLKFKNLKIHYYKKNNYYLTQLLKTFFDYIKFFFKRKISEIYFENLIKKINPKVGIGHEMDEKIFLFKKFLPDKFSLGYQHSFIFEGAINSFYKKKFQKKILDYYFVYDERSKNIMSKFIKSKYFITGSIKVNEHLNYLNKKKKKKYDISYVSRFRSFKNKKSNNYDLFLVRIIKEYCLRNNLKFVIIFASKRKDKDEVSNFYEREKKFYDSAIHDYIIGNQDGLNVSKQSKLTICSNSNLGYELLFTNHKVVFFCDDKEPFKFFDKKQGSIWYNGRKSKKIEKLISKIIKMSNKDWNKINHSLNKNFKYFYKNIDNFKNNFLLKKTVQRLITKHNNVRF